MQKKIYLQVTDKCNLKCPFCYMSRENIDLPINLAIAKIKETDADRIIFHGGEPLLRPDFILKIIDTFPNKEFSITSNMTLPLTDERLKVLYRCGVATSYSVDRFEDKNIYDIFLSNLRKYHGNFTLLVTLSNKQIKQPVKELIQTINTINPSSVTFERCYDTGADRIFYEKTDDYLCLILKNTHLLKAENNTLKNFVYAIKNNINVYPTHCNDNIITITPEGNFQTCPTANTVQKMKKECLSCDYMTYCRHDCCIFGNFNFCTFPKKTLEYVKQNLIIKRNSYKKKDVENISKKNEPNKSVFFTVDNAKYPNMYSAYDIFSKYFKIPKQNFILTNGCENACRIALLARNIKDITIENPTWDLFRIIAAGLNVKYYLHDYEYVNGIFQPTAINDKHEWLYTTDTYNNLFKHKNFSEDTYVNVIIDETYTLKYLKNYTTIPKNKIIVGSFSKAVGCGLRLGYILFNSIYNERFQLLREQYISSTAVEFLRNISEYDLNMEKDIDSPLCISSHKVYSTFSEKIGNNGKQFHVGKDIFFRYGI